MTMSGIKRDFHRAASAESSPEASNNPFLPIFERVTRRRKRSKSKRPRDSIRSLEEGRELRESHEDNSSGGALPSGHVGSSSVNGQPKEFDDVTRSDTSKWDGDTEASKEKEVDVPQVNGINKSTTGESTARSEVDEEARPRGKLAGIFKLKGKDSEMSEEKKKRKAREPKFTVGNQLRATILGSWLNILLLAVPVGIALHPAGVDPIIVFVVNFIAIIPLAAMLSFATEEIAIRTGETIGGLLNATFGNAVELIVSIIALVQDEVLVVKTSLIGSMLSNLLLVLGMCFFFGGYNRVEQNFNVVVAQTASSLLALAIGSLIIPTAFEQQSSNDGNNGSSVGERESNLAPLSRGTAVILLFVYGCYLFFQLKTHIEIYNAPSQKVEKKSSGKKKEGDATRGLAKIGGALAASKPNNENQAYHDEDDDDEETPQLSLWVALFTLGASTVLVAICAEFMVSSIDAVSEHISKTFVGLILLPIVGNAAEHATAVTVAIKDKMDLAIGVAVGSSMQIALLVLPLAVILGWILGKDDMTLFFDTFQIAVLFISILLVNYLIADGKSHWLEGIQLMILYILIALASWFYG